MIFFCQFQFTIILCFLFNKYNWDHSIASSQLNIWDIDLVGSSGGVCLSLLAALVLMNLTTGKLEGKQWDNHQTGMILQAEVSGIFPS